MRILLSTLLAFTLISCGQASIPQKNDDGDVLAVKEYTTIQGTKNLVDPIHGKRTGFWYGAMSGVDGTNANGVAYLHVFEDDFSNASVNLNIALAEGGDKYIVRLVDAQGETVDMGTLSPIVGDARHSAKIDTDKNLSAYLTVRVYLVKSGAETLVAAGNLKQPPAGTW